MDIKEIDFETLKNYWIDVDHFKDPNKRIVEVIKYLGPHTTPYSDPRRIAYGLYDKDKLIGATQLVHWNEGQVRYRTLNVREDYRGKGLGFLLLSTAYERDWQGWGNLFGWIRDTHYEWAKRHDFFEIDREWTDDHIAMERDM
jgi:GNAT superfamily N-acetyltransferase